MRPSYLSCALIALAAFAVPSVLPAGEPPAAATRGDPQTAAALEKARQSLKSLHEQLEARAGRGKYVAISQVYWTALDWCAADVERCLQAEEPKIISQASVLLADLQKRLADPQSVLGHVLDKAPEEADPLQAGKNPFFKGVVDAVRPMSTREQTWAKGHKGYLATPDAWWFAGRGNETYGIIWSMTRPKSPLRHHPMLLRNLLNRFDAIAHLHAKGDFNVDRKAIYGRDPNINRFCLAPALDAWREVHEAYPDLLPPAKRADLEGGLKQLADFQIDDYGTPRLAKNAHEKFPAYPNMDVHYLLIMELAHRLWGDPKYAKERDTFLKILEGAVFPMGAFTYVNTQNECFVYHQIDVLYLARFWKLSGDAGALALLKKTVPFYPYNVEPAGMPEYYTDACWKHYWGGGDAGAPAVIAALFDDPLNQRVAELCGRVYGYGQGHWAAIAAELWKPMASKPLPDGYVMVDTNIDGPRGRFGPWSFAGNGRDYRVGYQGKDTFVGCMVTDPVRRPLPLDAALQVVTTEVRLNPTDNHWKGGLCHSAREKLTTALGPDFGSLAVRYTVSRPNWGHKQDIVFPWEGTQEWYLSKSRLIGLVALEATADERRSAVHGRIRLGLTREVQKLSDTAWKYGKLTVKIHDHNYAQIVTQPSETFFLDKPEAYRSTEITLKDPLSVKAGEGKRERGEGKREKGEEKGAKKSFGSASKPGDSASVLFKKGTRYYFFVEVYPEGVAPAEEVKRIEQGSLCGFRFRQSDRRVVVLHNPTDAAIEVDLPLDSGVAKGTIYQTNDGKGRPYEGSRLRIRLEPHHHVVWAS